MALSRWGQRSRIRINLRLWNFNQLLFRLNGVQDIGIAEAFFSNYIK
jgi:hypothetical protein